MDNTKQDWWSGFQQGCRNEKYDVYSPVAKLCTFRINVAIANRLGLIIYQMDVQGAFLYGERSETVYMSLAGNSKCNSNTVSKLNKSIYVFFFKQH